MINTNKHLPRRLVLRGLGATLSLPLLDARLPARAIAGARVTTAPRRLSVVYFPHGGWGAPYKPPTVGPLQFSQILQPLSPFRDYLTVASGLDSKNMIAQD